MSTPIKMKLGAAVVVLFFIQIVSAQTQKGIDTQTRKIKEETNKTTTRESGEPPARSFDWGKGKTEVRDRLPNPYKVNSRRDVLVEMIMQVLKDRR